MQEKTTPKPVPKSYVTDPLFTSPEAASYIGVGVATLAVWRCVGRYNIQFVKVGRLVKYRKSALDSFLDRRTHGGEV
jgi:excisionase family DNA binding protein